MRMPCGRTFAIIALLIWPAIAGAGPDLAEIQRRAEAGDAEAQNALGVEAARVNDYIGAEQWYRKAAFQGHHRAQNAMAVLYLIGIPGKVEPDPVIAYAWYLLGAEASRDPNALRTMKGIEQRLTPEQLASAKARSENTRKFIEMLNPK